MTWEPPRSVSPGSAARPSAFAWESSPLIAARAESATQSSRRLRFFMTESYPLATLFGTTPLRTTLFARVSTDLDDAVLRRILTGVLELMQRALGDVKDVARAGLLGFAIVLEDDRALNDDDHLGVLDGVGRVRRRSSGLLGLVYVDDFAGGQGAVQHVAALAAVCHLARENLVERIHPRLRQRVRRCGLLLRYARHRCQSRQAGTHLAPR